MAVKLHRDRVPLRIDGHPCWRVEKALIDAGIPYEVVSEPVRRSRRARVVEAAGCGLVVPPGRPELLLSAVRYPFG